MQFLVIYNWLDDFLEGGGVGGIRSFGTGMSVLFHPVEDMNSIDTPNLSSTTISNCHFQQIIQVTNNLDILDISNCPGLDQSCIF